jgi:hypothetical protein
VLLLLLPTVQVRSTYNVLISSVPITRWLTVTTLLLAGLATVQQAKAADWSDVTTFVQTLAADTDTADSSVKWPLIVIKPLRGCASGDVYLCSSENEAKIALDAIIGTPMYATPGAVNEVCYAAQSTRTTLVLVVVYGVVSAR